MAKRLIFAVPLMLMISSFAWAGDSVTISMSCTIPSIPGVNAPERIPENVIRDYQGYDAVNSAYGEKEEIIEKEEKTDRDTPGGGKISAGMKTIYSR